MKISEIFYSIQGEGAQIGEPTVFLRLFACDLRCSWCDTMYAVEGTDFEELGIEEVFRTVEEHGCRRVCITGGEPLIQKKELIPLVERLIDSGYIIVLETSGHKKPPEIFNSESCIISMDCKCPGSGMHEKMDYQLFEDLREKDQLKFVIKDQADYDYAKNILNSFDISAKVIFQPVYGKNIAELSDMILKDKLNNVRILPQLHKIIWGDKRGV